MTPSTCHSWDSNKGSDVSGKIQLRKVKKHLKSKEINNLVGTEVGIRCRRECAQCWSGHSCSLGRGLSWHNLYLLHVERVTAETATLHPREVDVSWRSCSPKSEQVCPGGLQHTEGSVLELGKAQEEAAAALERPRPLWSNGLEALQELGMKEWNRAWEKEVGEIIFGFASVSHDLHLL